MNLLVGNHTTTFTKALKRANEDMPEGRAIWEETTSVFYHFVMDYVVGLYSKASDNMFARVECVYKLFIP